MKLTKADYLKYAKADESNQVRLTDVMTQETLFENRLDKVKHDTIYLMTVSGRNRSTGFLITVNKDGKIENATNNL